MRKYSIDAHRVYHSVRLVVTLFVLLGFLIQNVGGSAYYSLLMEPNTTVTSPPVVLQEGIAGNSTVYTNSTSAKVNVAAQRAWLTDWDKRIKLTIDHNDIDSALSNFSILVYLSTSSGRNNKDVSFVFDELQSDANRKKIAVTTGDGTTQCYVEIEKWDNANEKAWLWVKVPSISSTADTDLYLYYDKDHANNTDYVGDTGSTPAEKVWDSNFKMVQHMRDNTTSSIVDSTLNNNDGTKKAVNEPVEVDGKIARAQDFDAENDYVNVSDSDSLHLADGLTIEAWINVDMWGDDWRDIVFKGGGHPYDSDYELAAYTTGFAWDGTLNGTWRSKYFNTTTDTGVWIYVVITHDTTTVKCYRDGLEIDSQSDPGNIYVSTYQLRIGAHPLYAENRLNGTIDEVRISNIPRSAAWIKASYESERDDLVAYGSEEEKYDYVDNNDSNVDFSADKGTHSNFTAQQFGPDLINDTLTEAGGSDETTYDYSSGAGSNKWAYKGEASSPPADGPDITGQTEVTDYTLIESSNDVKDSFGPTSPGNRPYFNFKFTITESGITQLYLLFEGYPLAAGATVYLCLWNFTGSLWDTKNSTVATGGQDENFTATVTTGITDYINANDFLYFLVQDGTNKGTIYCDYVKVVVTYSVAYELDLEVQWTGVNYNEANEELCIYGGTMGSENITVDAWNGSAWKNRFTDLSSGWNNVSVSSYLTSSNFTIRFKGGNETGDTTQDSWNIDATLLHVWTSENYDYVLRVNNTDTGSWQIRLKKYGDSNINRLQNCTIYFHNSSDGTSRQIYIQNGLYINQTGPWYDLGDSETIYIAMTTQANSTATSYVRTYLEILTPSTTTYAQYIITFEIT